MFSVRRPELWRTTTARLTLLYGLVFAAGVVALLGLIYWSAAGYLTHQMDLIVTGQARALQSVAAPRLPEAVRAAQAQDVRNVNFYGLFDRQGAWIAGNVRHLPAGAPLDGVPRELHERGFQPGARGLSEQLGSGEILFVGFDAKVLAGLRGIILQSLLWSGALIILMGLTLGAALSLGPLRRIRHVQAASQPILEGDLSARLPVSGRRDEIDMLAGITNRMMDEVERLLWAVKSVGDNVAHDLRTPLTRLRALLYRAQSQFGEDDPRGAMLAQALAETDALLVRFRALQRISEIDRLERRAGFSPVRLDRLVEEIGELYEPLAEENGLRLTVQTEAAFEIPADRELLFEALSNLLGNAVKFTPSGGEVRLRLTNQAAGPRLEIIDTGPGVEEGEREAVLERFYRGRSGREAPGSGLGLSIVAAVSRLHGFALSLGDAGPGLKVTLDCWPAGAGY